MSTHLTSDVELWQNSLDGDDRAFASLFDRHKDRVFRHCVGMSGSQSEAEDLTAIAFFELWRHRGKVRIVDDSVLPWLLVTASHSARNASRARKRYLNMLSRLPHDEDCVDTAEEEALRALPFDATTSPLAKALQKLPEVDEQLMRLVALEGLTTADAARLLGLRPEAARARLMRARRRLASLPEITSLVNAMPL